MSSPLSATQRTCEFGAYVADLYHIPMVRDQQSQRVAWVVLSTTGTDFLLFNTPIEPKDSSCEESCTGVMIDAIILVLGPRMQVTGSISQSAVCVVRMMQSLAND